MRSVRQLSYALIAILSFVMTSPAEAAVSLVDFGVTPNMIWAIPFAGVLLSIALGPLINPDFWHHHYGKIIHSWTLIAMVVYVTTLGWRGTASVVLTVLTAEYIPFIALIGTLFVVGTGVFVDLRGNATPLGNTLLLGVGAILSNFVGTTGSSLILIHPLLRINRERQKKAHLVIFFIFLVSNVGGCLTPLGDPPLFLGYLQGVPFTWNFLYCWPEFVVMLISLLMVFFFVDIRAFQREHEGQLPDFWHRLKFHLEGHRNLFMLALVIVVLMVSGTFIRKVDDWHILDAHVNPIGVLRDLSLFTLLGISWKITPIVIREKNEFSWEPLMEVVKVFLGIFLTMVPVITLLKMGLEGPFRPLIALLNPGGEPQPHWYFWATGLLSGFLDNAPTYLVFFNVAGGDVATLTTTLSPVLVAISIGAVFMGALTYIGNAPNFMVRTIAAHNGVKMPSFFGYTVWSFIILLPLFFMIDYIFLGPMSG